MGRYSKSNILRNKDGKSFVRTTMYNEIPESNNDIWVISQYGDRLDLLAHQFYGDASLWWVLAKANKLSFLKLPIGASVRIPPMEIVNKVI